MVTFILTVQIWLSFWYPEETYGSPIYQSSQQLSMLDKYHFLGAWLRCLEWNVKYFKDTPFAQRIQSELPLKKKAGFRVLRDFKHLFIYCLQMLCLKDRVFDKRNFTSRLRVWKINTAHFMCAGVCVCVCVCECVFVCMSMCVCFCVWVHVN